jgi:hypothetical protein
MIYLNKIDIRLALIVISLLTVEFGKVMQLMTSNIFKKILIPISMLTLFSCGTSDQDSIAKICQSKPALCADLHKANECRYKRSSLIRARYYDEREPTEEHTLNLLDELSGYGSCLELTMLMQFTQRKGRKQKSIENYFTTKKIMEDKLKEVKSTQDPHIAYYLWTHFQDLHAKSVFLHAANKKETKDAKLLIKLATFYAKDYPQ